MILGLLLGCNNGGELEAQKRLGEIGRSAENAFYEFMGLIADTLGFRVTAETKKSEVGSYLSGLGEKIGKASEELEKVAEKAAVDDDKDGLLSKAIREAVETAKVTLNKLKEHLDTLKGIGGEQKVGEAANNNKGEKPDYEELKKVHKALQEIVKAAIAEGVEKPEVGATTLTVNGVDNKDGAKILATQSGNNKPSAPDAGKAALIVSAVSGKEILASIFKSTEGDLELGGSAPNETTTAMSFARGGDSGSQLAGAATPKAAAVVGGIALRSLVKEGKLATGAANNQGGPGEVQAVGIDAVNKLLGAVEDIIKKTVKNVLDKTKTKIDEARSPKTVG